jgi:hypothetical protein
MMAGTSPSITAVAGGYQIAFEANTGMLWTTGKYGTHNLGLGMSKYGSPSIAAVTDGYVIAFKANTGKAWLAGTLGHRSLGVQMDTFANNENPAIAAHGTTWEIACMAISNEIWTATNTSQGDTGQESQDFTSPAIGWNAHEGWVTSFVTNTVPGHSVLGLGSDFVVRTTTDVASNTSVAVAVDDYGVVTAYVSSAIPAVVVNGQYFGIP